ncbi:MAG TPA: DUF885 domain-containing protein [Mycobacteriales bacterium]|nr:DUF885 domain-containing protein [Mycobacteriales bacterium]
MASPVFDICERYVVGLAALDPVWGTMRGVAGAAGAATDYGPAGTEAKTDLARSTLADLDRAEAAFSTGPAGATGAGGATGAAAPGDAAGSAADGAAAVFLRGRLRAELAAAEAGEPYRALRAPFGLLSTVRDSVDLLPKASDDDWNAVGARLSAVPLMLASWRDSLQVGLDRGLPAARRQAVEAALQADRYSEGTTHAPVVTAYGDGPLGPALAAAAIDAHSAYADTADWLRKVYAPRAAEADGVGPERHALFRRLMLGADPDPVESYEWAWAELHRIEDEMAAEAERVAPGAGIEGARALLDETDVVEGTEAYRVWLQEQHDAAIQRLDGVHFDIAPELRAVDATLAIGSSSGSAYYTPPDEAFTRPGRTWWPLGDRDRFAVWAEQTTVFHEGVPGHHLQLGQARLMGDRLSRHQKVGGVPGHSEGWALYAERLADELGWFDTPGRRLGMLKGSALRAARVVIDLGVHLDLPIPAAEAERHGPRWTFEVATEVLRDRGRIAAHRLHPEIVRYFGWPAQATAYKLGERAWLAARDEARTRLGAGFDLKAWHTAALGLGPVQLDDLAAALRTAG